MHVYREKTRQPTKGLTVESTQNVLTNVANVHSRQIIIVDIHNYKNIFQREGSTVYMYIPVFLIETLNYTSCT